MEIWYTTSKFITLIKQDLELVMENNKKLLQKKKVCIILEDLENRDFISLIEYVSGDRLVILNIIILRGKVI